jgi:hypothetical protein
MKIVTLGTPLGLGFASGLNAYLPLLSFAIAVRWLHLYHVNSNFAFITQDWFIILLAILTIVDFVANKIPLIDHAWNATHTVIRPIAGAIVAAASANQSPASGTIFSVISTNHLLGAGIDAANGISLASDGLLIILLLGGILAFLSHTVKATTRLISTITTAGFLNPVLSILEDGIVFIIILLSLFAPVIMLILLVIFLVIFGPRLLRVWSRRGRI